MTTSWPSAASDAASGRPRKPVPPAMTTFIGSIYWVARGTWWLRLTTTFQFILTNQLVMARPARVSPDRILAAAALEFAERGFAGARVDASPGAPR